MKKLTRETSSKKVREVIHNRAESPILIRRRLSLFKRALLGADKEKEAPLSLRGIPKTDTDIKQFDGLKIQAVIFKSEKSIVYHATVLGTSHQLALKAPTECGLANREWLSSFKHEIRVLRRIEHPGIVQMTRAAKISERPFYTSNLILGKNGAVAPSLSQLLSETKISTGTAVRYIRELCATLSWLHDSGILHGDISLSNIVIDESDRPKLLDFNLAVFLDERGRPVGPIARGGTFGFAPPERFTEEWGLMGTYSDVFGIGAVLKWLLINRVPSLWRDFAVAPRRNLEGLPLFQISAQTLPSEIPQKLRAIVAKCLERNPRRRYRDCSSLVDALSKF
ncbi:MAG: protein kinase [Verrucomicrobiales bacterium]|nr:protein kinase [Verrucomicrobiales bacterium]